MKISLNTDSKHSMFGVGKRAFLTFENPGPVELDPKVLDRQELTQLVFGIRHGVLKVDGLDELNVVLEGIQKSTPPKTQAPIPEKVLFASKQAVESLEETIKTVTKEPIKLQEHTIEEVQETELKQLKELLSGTMASVKKEVVGLSPSKLRKLLALEKEGQKRKGLMNLIGDLLTKHQEAVTSKIGTEDIGTATAASKAEIGKGMHGVILDNISDVVESDVTPVTLK